LTVDFHEPEHIRMLRDQLSRFVEEQMPRSAARTWDKEDSFPRAVFDKLAALGVMGLTVSEEYGGSGRDILAAMITIEELAKRSLAVAIPYIMCACYGGMNISECGTEEQKRRLLPELAAGRMLFAYGMTEPDVGSDLASVKTRAERTARGIRVNGAKRFCSGPQIADFIYTLVRSGNAADRYRNLSFLLIPPNLPGVHIERMESLGMRGVGTTDVTFENVEIPDENIVGGETAWNDAWRMLAGPALDVEKIEVAALALGIAGAALLDAWEYSQQRIQFGKPICAHQAVRHALADGHAKLHAARLVLYHAAWTANDNRPCGIETSIAKLFVCEVAKEVVLSCQTVMGAYGYIAENDMERYVRDILLTPIIGGSSAIQRNNLSNRLGLPR
jgi:alkylation response protein AidB-like acyl-CoA dehydrogenase